MNTAAVTPIHPSTGLATPPAVASMPHLRRKAPPPPKRLWAEYKPPPWWTAALAFVLSIALHLGAVALLERGPEGRVARLWENRILIGEELRPNEQAND